MTAEMKYSMSFTSGPLFRHESARILELFFSLKQWDKVRETVIAGNVIQARTANTLKRITSEIISRLKTLTAQEAGLFAKATYKARGYILWLAMCRRYAFIGDFAIEVLHNNFIFLKNTVTYDDYIAFFNRKAEWHPEVDRIALATQRKLRQTLFQSMREAELLDKENTIIPVLPGGDVRQLLAAVEKRETMFFPILAS